MIGVAAVILSVVAEALAAYTLGEWFAAGYAEGAHHAIPAIGLIIIGLAAYGLPRVIEWFGLGRRAAMAAMGAAVMVILYGSLRIYFSGDVAIWNWAWVARFLGDPQGTLEGRGHVLIGTILVVGLWARSAYRASEEVELETYPRGMAPAFVLVTLVVALSVYSARSGEVARAGAAFYAVAVVGLAFSQLGRSGATFGDLRAGSVTGLIVLGTVGATFGAVVVFFLAFGVIGPIIGPPLEAAVIGILTVILYPFVWVLERIFSLLFGDSNPFARPPPPAPPVVVDDPSSGDTTDGGWKLAGTYLFRGIALVVAVAVVGGLIAWFTRLRRKSRAKAADGSSESLPGALGADLRNMFGRFRRGHGEDAETPSSAARRLYMEVVASAANVGTARDLSETPEEFAPRLHGALHTSVTNEITAAFEQSRYAGREPDARTVAELERRWREVKAIGR